MRVLQWVMAAAFALSVAVQYNDPDPVQWMAIYGAAMVAAIWAARRPGAYPWWFPALVGVAALTWACSLMPQVASHFQIPEMFASWEMKNARVEVERETSGLLLVTGWMAITMLIALFRPRRAPAPS